MFPRIVERPVTEHVEIPVERLRQEIKTTDTFVDVPLEKHRIVEKVQDTIKEVEVPLTRIVEKTKIVPKIVERYVDKYVDTYVYVTNPIYKEVVVEAPVTDKNVTLTTKLERLNVVSIPVPRPMNTYVRGQVVKQSQIDRLNRTNQELAKHIEENIKLQANVDGLRTTLNAQSSLFRVTPQMIDELKRREHQLRTTIDGISQENARLRAELSKETELEQQVEYDAQLVPVLREQIKVVREHNEGLKNLVRQGSFKSTTHQIGREFAGQVIHHPKSHYTGSRTSSYSSASVSRSASPSPVRVVPSIPARNASRIVTNNPVAATSRAPHVTFAAQPIIHGKKIARATSPVRTLSGVPQTGSRVIVHDSRPTGHLRSNSSYSGSGSYYSSSPSRSRGSTLSPQPVRVVGGAYPERVVGNRYQSRVDALVGGKIPYSSNSTGTSFYPSSFQASRPTTNYAYGTTVHQGPDQNIMNSLSSKVSAYPPAGATGYVVNQPRTTLVSLDSGAKREFGSTVGTSDNSLYEGISRVFHNHEQLLANVQNPFRR